MAADRITLRANHTNKQEQMNDSCDEESLGALQGAVRAEKRESGPSWTDQRRGEQLGGREDQDQGAGRFSIGDGLLSGSQKRGRGMKKQLI